MPDPTDIWQVFASEGVIYDDNLFRQSSKRRIIPAGLSKSDIINRLSAGGRINYPWGRQQFLVDLRFDDNRYARNGLLDHQATNDKVIWNWLAGQYFSGEAGYSYRRYMGGFTNTTFFGKDLIDENIAYVKAQASLDPNWRIRGGVDWLDSTHSASLRRFLDRKSVGGTVGADYISTAGNTVGLEYRFAETDLPNQELLTFAAIDNHYKEQIISAVVDWSVFDKTRLEGRVGYANREYRTFSSRDYSGDVWRMSLIWEPTSKIYVILMGWKDLYSSQDVTATHIVAEGVSLSPSWRITPKITLTGRIAQESRDYSGDPGLGSDAVRKDDILSGQVALRYLPTLGTELNLSYLTEHRTSNAHRLGLVPADYDYSSIFASAQIKF